MNYIVMHGLPNYDHPVPKTQYGWLYSISFARGQEFANQICFSVSRMSLWATWIEAMHLGKGMYPQLVWKEKNVIFRDN